jgi:hypothetical protein
VLRIAEEVSARREPSPAALATMLRFARGASASPPSGRGGASSRHFLESMCDCPCGLRRRAPSGLYGSRHAVIASAAKQSRIPPRKDSGLLRCARNDERRGRRRPAASCRN